MSILRLEVLYEKMAFGGTVPLFDGVTSDGILFGRSEQVTEVVDEEVFVYRDSVLYRIDLGSGQWKLEHFATVLQTRMPEKE